MYVQEVPVTLGLWLDEEPIEPSAEPAYASILRQQRMREVRRRWRLHVGAMILYLVAIASLFRYLLASR